jgi:hypothetical protein
MIPSIETIVQDLAAGKITKSQAVTWLHAHAEGAANELRDHFAAAALTGFLTNDSMISAAVRTASAFKRTPEQVTAIKCYTFANAMMEVRKAK